MATIKCPGCGAEIDTEKNTAEFREVPASPPEIPPAGDPPAPAIRRGGNAFFKPRKKE